MLEPVVSAIPKTFTADSIDALGGGVYRLNSCDTLWLTLNRKVAIGATIYTITDLEPNQWVKVSGSLAPSTDTFDIYTPFFRHGTIIATNEELNRKHLHTDKLPMIYLHEITRERFSSDPEIAQDRESECDLHFLTDANFRDWKVVDHYKYAIAPMRNLLFAFVNQLKNSTFVGEFDEYDVLDHAKWGVFIADRGSEKGIFDDQLSGSQLRINIPFLKEMNCSTYC